MEHFERPAKRVCIFSGGSLPIEIWERIFAWRTYIIEGEYRRRVNKGVYHWFPVTHELNEIMWSKDVPNRPEVLYTSYVRNKFWSTRSTGSYRPESRATRCMRLFHPMPKKVSKGHRVYSRRKYQLNCICCGIKMVTTLSDATFVANSERGHICVGCRRKECYKEGRFGIHLFRDEVL